MANHAGNAGQRKTMKNISFVHGEDWVGLYIDGKLMAQGHSLSNVQVLACLGITSNRIDVGQDWLSEQGYLPTNLEDVRVESRRDTK